MKRICEDNITICNKPQKLIGWGWINIDIENIALLCPFGLKRNNTQIIFFSNCRNIVLYAVGLSAQKICKNKMLSVMDIFWLFCNFEPLRLIKHKSGVNGDIDGNIGNTAHNVPCLLFPDGNCGEWGKIFWHNIAEIVGDIIGAYTCGISDF